MRKSGDRQREAYADGKIRFAKAVRCEDRGQILEQIDYTGAGEDASVSMGSIE